MDLNQLLINLLSAEDRTASARNLAMALGGDDLILFMPDPEIAILLPVVGFPQTLLGGRQWREFFRANSNLDFIRAQLPSPYTGETISVVVVCGTTGIVLALLGGDPDEGLLQSLIGPLSLAGQALDKTQRLRLANAQLEHMRSEVKSARVLTNVLDQLRRELEQALDSASRETAAAEAAKSDLLKANQELALARDQALAASHSKGAFLANMSHELRTPLTAIIGYSEMLQDTVPDEQSRQDLQRINDAGQHLVSLVNDILDMAKIESGHVEIHLETFAAEGVVTEAVEIVTPQMASRGNTCTVNISPGLPLLVSDRGKLRQILLNLLSNAAKFTENGLVTIAVDYDEVNDHIRYSVNDTGMGIAADALPRLFKEFSQLDDSSTKIFPGTGLGLAISKRMCELFGGQITVESQLGVGSTFRVIIPSRISKDGKQRHLSP